MFFSNQTRGFYDPEININIPDDAVEIGADLHRELLDGQALGRVISVTEDGSPILADRPEPSADDLLAAQRRNMTCTRYQLRAALHVEGMLAKMDEAAADDPMSKIAWEHAATFRRDSATIGMLSNKIGISDEELDMLFVRGMTLAP